MCCIISSELEKNNETYLKECGLNKMKIVEQKSGHLEAVPDELIQCPFCHEKDFDLIGLKIHLKHDWCEVYNNTPVHDLPKDSDKIREEILETRELLISQLKKLGF